MENKGIFRHSRLKTFFTNGFLGKLFRLILFKKEDYIHFRFINCLSGNISKIQKSKGNFNKVIFLYWFVQLPRELFEELFVEGESKSEIMNFALKNAENPKSEKCAYITQAYILWNYENILRSDTVLGSAMQNTVADFENIIKSNIASADEIIEYLNFFRHVFDVTDNGNAPVNPQDRILIYIFEICKILYKDNNKIQEALNKVDQNVRQKLILNFFDVAFFAEAKKSAINLALGRGIR
ncbi:MAG: hypothetical protein PHD97_05310 [Bacteroidales bacterium]|nr:hypothetical protein [Bacteroidales bacterium]